MLWNLKCTHHILELGYKQRIIMKAPEITFFCHFGPDIIKLVILEFSVHENIFFYIKFFLVVDYFAAGINYQRRQVKILIQGFE